MEQGQRPEKKGWDSQPKECTCVAVDSYIRLVDDVVLNRRHHPSIDPHDDANQSCAHASNSCNKSFPARRPLSGDRLAWVGFGKVETLSLS